MLFLGSSPCKTCSGTEPSAWRCDPAGLLGLGGGHHSYASLSSEFKKLCGQEHAFRVDLPVYECMGAPYQIGPRLKALGGVLGVQLYMVMEVSASRQEAWEERRFRPQHEEFCAALLYIWGTATSKNLQALALFMEEAKQAIGRVGWVIQLNPE